MSLKAETLLDRLREEDVLHVDPKDDSVHLTGSYLADVERTLTDVRGADGVDRALGSLDAGSGSDTFAAIADDDPDIIARYLVLRDRIPDLSQPVLFRATVVLDQLSDPPRTDGAPNCCLPVRGERLQTFLRFGQPSVVYVWREDCEPCALVSAELEEISPEDDIALFAVYGPGNASLLYENYNVTGAPTLLFVADGGVNTRLFGAQHRVAIESELSRLREDGPGVEI